MYIISLITVNMYQSRTGNKDILLSSISLSSFPPLCLPLSSSLCLPHLHFCWLLCTINISCVMWLFWILWACVCAPVSLRLCECMYTHTYVCLGLHMCVRARLFVCLCRSIKFCSHSCRLVSAWLWSACLPLNLQPLLLFHTLSSFLLSFSSASLCSSSLFFISLSLLLPWFFSSMASSCVSPSMPSPFIPLCYLNPSFSLPLLATSCFALAVVTSLPFILKILSRFFFPFSF